MTLDYIANEAIAKQLRIMGYSFGSAEWDGALAAARAFINRGLTARIPVPGRTVEQGRPFEDLSHSGLLWLINRVAFHPRGFRLALVADQKTGAVTGWELQGDGTDPHWFPEEVDRQRFDQAEATLRQTAHAAECDHCQNTIREAYGRGRDDEAAGDPIPPEMGA